MSEHLKISNLNRILKKNKQFPKIRNKNNLFKNQEETIISVDRE